MFDLMKQIQSFLNFDELNICLTKELCSSHFHEVIDAKCIMTVNRVFSLIEDMCQM